MLTNLFVFVNSFFGVYRFLPEVEYREESSKTPDILPHHEILTGHPIFSIWEPRVVTILLITQMRFDMSLQGVFWLANLSYRFLTGSSSAKAM